jgi:DnaJ-class molecular chaperone
MNFEPIFAVPNWICGTCRMAMYLDRPISLRGVAVLRYPCDSCKGQGTVTVKIPESPQCEGDQSA